jgi:hypothetical protein
LQWQADPESWMWLAEARVGGAVYDADANWNLRTDLEHPVSFTHNAPAIGTTLSSGLSYPVAERARLFVGVEYTLWHALPGSHTMFFSDGTAGGSQLNEVNWSSLLAHAGLTWRF